MIDRVTVDKIMDAAQIVDVVSDFVTLRKSGANLKGLCPFHDDRTPSFVVSPAKNFCKCFACGKGGNPVHFIMEHEQLSYPDALRYLAHKYNIEINERQQTDEERRAENARQSMFILNEWACKFFQNQLRNTDDGRAFGLAYLRSRGFRDDIIEKFQLGYCPTRRDACTCEAKTKGYKEQYLLDTGLSIKRQDGTTYDRFSNRVIFPIHTLSGKVVAFGGRVLDAATKGVNIKYQNSPESAIYSKKKELYGLFLAKQAIVRNDLCYLVEGYTDVISMHQMGVENVVSSSGTALTIEQIRMIHRFTDNITVLYDGDAAGIKASERGTDMLLAEGMNVKLLLFPDGDDPDSFARKHNATEYQNYLAEHQVDFIKFKTNLLLNEAKDDPVKLSQLATSIVHTISVIPDPITRSLYTRQTAMLLQMEERILVAAIAKERTRAKEERTRARQNEQRHQETLASPDTTQPTDQETNPEKPTPETQPTTTEHTHNDPLLPDNPTKQTTFYQKELLIVRMIIRYGDKVLCEQEENPGNYRPVTVAEYIRLSLQEDGLTFRTDLHRRILDEAVTHLKDNNFNTENHFINHPDNDIATLAFQLCSNKYQLSKLHQRNQKVVPDEDRLTTVVPHLVADYKLAVVDEELKQILHRLRQPQTLQHKEQYIELMKQYKTLQNIKQTLARNRGDRVIS